MAVGRMRFADPALLITDFHMGRNVITGEETQRERRGQTRGRRQESSLGNDEVKEEKPMKD